jgi:hypothetical protein
MRIQRCAGRRAVWTCPVAHGQKSLFLAVLGMALKITIQKVLEVHQLWCNDMRPDNTPEFTSASSETIGRYGMVFRDKWDSPKSGIFSAERHYAKQISPLDGLFKVVPITGHHTFVCCNPVIKNLQ